MCNSSGSQLVKVLNYKTKKKLVRKFYLVTVKISQYVPVLY